MSVSARPCRSLASTVRRRGHVCHRAREGSRSDGGARWPSFQPRLSRCAPQALGREAGKLLSRSPPLSSTLALCALSFPACARHRAPSTSLIVVRIIALVFTRIGIFIILITYTHFLGSQSTPCTVSGRGSPSLPQLRRLPRQKCSRPLRCLRFGQLPLRYGKAKGSPTVISTSVKPTTGDNDNARCLQRPAKVNVEQVVALPLQAVHSSHLRG